MSLAACGLQDYKVVEAEVVGIERTCEFNVQRPPGKYSEREAPDVSQKCDATSQFARIQEMDPKTRMKVVGSATIHVNYRPIGSDVPQIGTIAYDGNDEEFYVKQGDKIEIYVNQTNPADITDV